MQVKVIYYVLHHGKDTGCNMTACIDPVCHVMPLQMLAGTEIVPYMGPKPPIGIHRYIFILFEQRGPLMVTSPPVRNNFNTRTFAARYGLGLPVAAVYFNAQKEAGSRRR